MRTSSKLIKQHFNARIFKSYFDYIRDHYPAVDVKELCAKAGLELEYLQNENNWVSCEFNRRLMMLFSEKIRDPDFSRKVGASSVSREGLGAALFNMGKNVFDLKDIYENLWRLSSFLNRVVDVKVISTGRQQITLRVKPIFEGLDEVNAEALGKLIPFIIQSTVGYYAAIPRLKGLPEAKVEVSEHADEFLFEIQYPMESIRRREAVVAGLVTLVAGFGVGMSTGLAWGLVMSAGFSMIYGFRLGRRMVTDLRATANHVQDNIELVNQQYRRLQVTQEELDRKLLEARALNAVSSHLVSDLPEQTILDNICRDLCEILSFDRVLIFLRDGTESYLEYRAGHIGQSDLGPLFKDLKFEIHIESDDPTKISNVYRKRQPILIENVASHLASLNEESRRALQFSGSKSFLSVPVFADNDSLGVILADHFISSRRLTDSDLRVLGNVAMQVAVVLQKVRAQHRLAVAYDEIERLANSYSRFVPFRMIDLIGFKRVTDVHLRAGREYEMAIVFSDIRGFTSMSEKMPPTESVAFLNSYFSSLAPVFEDHGGIIDKFLGDGIMALFLKPDEAMNAAVEFQQRLVRYNQAHRSGGRRELIKAGIGIHFGRVLLGAVGYENRMSISVTSDSVNLASRIDGLNKKFGVDMVCSSEFVEKISNRSGVRFIALIRVDGRQSATEIFEMIAHLPSEEQTRRKEAEPILKNLCEHLQRGESAMARILAEQGLKMFPKDPVLNHYLLTIEPIQAVTTRQAS